MCGVKKQVNALPRMLSAARGQVGVVGCHGASLERMKHFGGVKAEHLRVAETANHTPLVRAAESMCGVKKQVNALPRGDLFQAPDVAGAPP